MDTCVPPPKEVEVGGSKAQGISKASADPSLSVCRSQGYHFIVPLMTVLTYESN